MSALPITTILPDDRHQALMAAFKDALKAHGMDITPIEWLAIASQFVGLLTAAQDQRKYTSADIMEVVGANIEQGNRDFVNSMMQTQGGVQ